MLQMSPVPVVTESRMQLAAKNSALVLIDLQKGVLAMPVAPHSAAEHGYELVIPEDLCSSVSAEMHAFSLKHILPRLARMCRSEEITLG
jgi:nicotinamidase-related amidase